MERPTVKTTEAMKAKQRLKELAGQVESESLDDLVHECKGQEAAAINNEGVEGQIEYLGNCMRRSELIRVLEQVLATKS